MAEHSTADREVTGSTPVVPLQVLCFFPKSVSPKNSELNITCFITLEGHKSHALPGNRTRVTRMGILYDTTTPAAQTGDAGD